MAALCPLCKLERLKLRGTRRAFHPMFQKGRLDVLAEANGSSENFVQGDIPHREACRMSRQNMHNVHFPRTA